MMKNLLLIFAICFLIESIALSQEKLNWISMNELDLKIKEEPKTVLVYVYTDWCSFCKKMEMTTLKDEDLISYLNTNYHLVKLNAETTDILLFKGKKYINPNPGAAKSRHQLALKLAVMDGMIGFPTTVLLDEDYNIIGLQARGYRTVERYVEYLEDNKIDVLTYY